jgi:D-alanine-D-alanine ligase
MQYLVLGGGISPEKSVSIRSATAVHQALESLGHSSILQDPAGLSVDELVERAKQFDGVFPILHGVGGEDGVLQHALNTAGIPYFGPDATACSNTFDKGGFKRILESHGLPTPRWSIVSSETFETEALTTSPFVLKPIMGGSSIDTFIIRSMDYDHTPLLEALSRYDTMLLEELIEGDEITVGVLARTALPVIEIIPPTHGEFDYENKYNGATQELCPPVNVSDEIQAKAQALTLQVHEVTQCRHLSRTDIIVTKSGELYVLETNTIPGLTDQSLFPKAAAVAGYTWPQLVEQFTTLIHT